MKVNIKDYYPNADYSEYLKRGNPIDKPKNTTLEVGILMYDKPHNSIGMILGCIDEEFDGDVRLDTDGMQSIDSLRLAKPTDFKIDGVNFATDLDKIL